MGMLNGKLALHGVPDVENLCVRVLENWERRTNTSLNTSDRDDAVAYLLATAWEIAEFKFNPDLGVRFDSHLYSILSFRVTDWLRLDEGRTKWQFSTHTYERPKETILSLDGPAHPTGDDRDPGRLGELVAVHGSSRLSDPDALLERLERKRDSDRDRHLKLLRDVLYSRVA